MTVTQLETALKQGKLELPGNLALEIPRLEPVPIGELVAAITDGALEGVRTQPYTVTDAASLVTPLTELSTFRAFTYPITQGRRASCLASSSTVILYRRLAR